MTLIDSNLIIIDYYNSIFKTEIPVSSSHSSSKVGLKAGIGGATAVVVIVIFVAGGLFYRKRYLSQIPKNNTHINWSISLS